MHQTGKTETSAQATPATVTETLKARGAIYGDFENHAALAQQLQDVLRHFTGIPRNLDLATRGPLAFYTPAWSGLAAVQKQALTVICDKLARILSGDSMYEDNWHDIQGYAKLVEDWIRKVKDAQKIESAAE